MLGDCYDVGYGGGRYGYGYDRSDYRWELV